MTSAAELAPRLYTAEELEQLSAQGHRYELVRGRLRPTPPTGPEHGRTTMTLSARATVHAEENDLGACFAAETGFKLEVDPDTILAPDWAFVSRDRVPRPIPRTFAQLVPELVLETRSPSESAREFAAKAEEWLEAGVRMVWSLDPVQRRLTVRRPGKAPRVYGPDRELGGEDVLPGFQINLSRVFD